MSMSDPIPQHLSFSMPVDFRAIVHHEDGSFWAEIEEMPGCFASGDSMDELVESLTEAMGLYLSSSGVTVTINELRLVPIESPRLVEQEYQEYKVLLDSCVPA